MIFKKKKQASWIHEVEKRKVEIIQAAGGESATIDSVMDVLFGTRYQEYEDNQYFVYGYDEPRTTRKWWQRLNALWVVPSVMIIVFPIQWVFKGEVGVKENTKFGRIVIKMIGDD